MNTNYHLIIGILMPVVCYGHFSFHDFPEPALVDPGPIIYVDANASGAGTGESWADAFTTLQDALTLACADAMVTEVWVAAGTYYPDEGVGYTNDDRIASFLLCDNVAIYGGFTGTETLLSQRDFETNVTVLSGDINQDFDLFANSYTVVTGSGTTGTAVLDGFTITMGNADDFVETEHHSFRSGGGMYNDGGDPTVSNCIFSGNYADQFGGGMYNSFSSPAITSCIFLSNNTNTGGGGMYNTESSPAISFTTFETNTSSLNGGGMNNENDSNPILAACSFTSNSGLIGGGMNSFLSEPELTQCTFTGNSALFVGGGMYLSNGNSTLLNCVFEANGTIFSHGAGIYNDAASPDLINCLFYNNVSGFFGGGIHNAFGSSPKVINCTFSGNTAFDGGSMYSDDTGDDPIVINSICWGNGSEIVVANSATTTISFSLIELGCPSGASCTDIFDVDPEFVDQFAGDLRLMETSPAINAGDDAANTSVMDLDGNPRFSGASIDMGAYEFQELCNVDPPPAENQEFCGGDDPTVADLMATGTNLLWYDVAEEGTPLSVTDPLETSTYYVSQTIDDCESDRTTVEVTVEPAPASGMLVKSPDALSVCEGVNVSAILTAGMGGNDTDELDYRTHNGTEWSVWSAYISGTDISTAGLTEVEIRTRRLADICAHADYVTVGWIIDEPPVADAGMGGEECDLDFVLNAAPSAGTGVWTYSGPGTASFDPGPGNPAATVTVSEYGSYIFTWTESNGVCDDDMDDIMVTFYQQPIADAGVGGDECDLDFILNAVPSAGTGVWTYDGPGTATFTPDATDAGATVMVDEFGLYTFTWTESNGVCDVDADDIMITFYDPPIAEAGTGGEECDTDFELNAVLSTGTGEWSYTGPGTATFDPDENTPDATVTISMFGMYMFTWTETNGTCTDDDEVMVTFYEQPITDAGSGGSECDLDFELNAVPSVGMGTWTYTGPGTATFDPDANDAGAIAMVSAFGVYTFTWTESNGVCDDDMDDIMVTFYQQPIADAGVGGDECDLDFILNAVPSAGTGVWTYDGPGTATFTPDATDAGATVMVDEFGLYTFTWTESNGVCDADADDVIVDFFEQPVADAGMGGEECDLDFVLNAIPSVGTGEWTYSGPGTASFDPGADDPASTVTVSEYGTYTFTWTESNGVCDDDAEDVMVNFYATPVCMIDGLVSVCPGTTGILYAGPEEMSAYEWSISSGGIIVGSNTSSTILVDADNYCSTSYTLTLTVTDENGCSSICMKEVSVLDDEYPDVIMTSIATCYPNIAAAEAAALAATTAMDNCTAEEDLNFAVSTSGTCQAIVTVTVTDLCNNSTSVMYTTRIDNTAPTGSAPPGTSGHNVCFANVTTAFPFVPASVAMSYSDNCDGPLTPTLTNTLLIGDDCAWILIYSYYVVDACGNILPGQIISYTGSDQTPPSGSPPAPSLGNNACRANATTVYPFNPTSAAAGYTDNCMGPVTATLTSTQVIGTDCNWAIFYNFRVTDACGNSLTNQQIVIAGSDQTDPTFTRPDNITIYTNAACDYDEDPEFTGKVLDAMDNCSLGVNVPTYDDVTVAGPCEGIHVITRTWSLVDACGNTAEDQVQTITVSDNTVPTFTRPDDTTIFTDANCEYDADPSETGDVEDEADNCSTGLEAMYDDEIVAGPCEGTFVITRTWSLVDNCGNPATDQVQTVTVIDNTIPTFTRPDDTTVFTDMNCAYDASVEETGDVEDEADNCSTGLEATFDDEVVAGPCEGTFVITRTWSLIDDCSNPAANQVQTITVSDNTVPTFTRPDDTTIFTDANCAYDASVVETGDVEDETDNCSAGLEAMYDDEIVAGPCEGTFVITRTWSLVDNCGNPAANQVQIITVSDNTVPTFTRPDDTTIFTDANCVYDASVEETGDVEDEADNCSTGLEATFDDEVVDGPCEGTFVITRTWSLVDNCGNPAANQVQTIMVLDDLDPTFTVPGNTTIYTDEDCAYDASTGITGDVTDEDDNCTTVLNATFDDEVIDGSCEGSKIITRTWTLEDDCGNETVQVQTITVQDNHGPDVTAPAAMGLECSTDIPDAATTITEFLALIGAEASDNCADQANLTVSSNTAILMEDECSGTITRTYSIEDPCGNITMVDHVFNVSDNTVPVIAVGELEDCYETVAEAEAAALALTMTNATDNCTGDLSFDVDLIVDPENPLCDSLIIVTVTDECDNSSMIEYTTRISCQQVRLKVYLEGAYNSVQDTMRTTLNNDHLLPGQINTIPFVSNTPPGQPYSVAPHSYNYNTGMDFGDGVGDTPYPEDVVDWVLVMVRAEGILPEHTIWTCAGWVHSDGRVSFPEECEALEINIDNDYHLLVQHRNHLGVLSPFFVDIACGGAYIVWDFTVEDSYKPRFRAGQKLIGSKWAMFGANGEQINSIPVISSPDRTQWSQQQGQNGYRTGDYNMNHTVDGPDETMWKLNQNKSSGVIFY